jgi:hypothetical protein
MARVDGGGTTNLELWLAVAAIAGVVIAAVSLIVSARATHAATGLYKLEAARREAEVEAAKVAVVRAMFVIQDRPSDPAARMPTREATWLEVSNEGPSDARDVEVSFPRSKPPHSLDLSDLPTVLRPGDRHQARFVAVPRTNLPALVRWSDGRTGPGDPPHELHVPYRLQHR